MKNARNMQFGVLVALAGAIALSACGKKEEPAPPPPPAAAPAPTPPPPAAPAPAPVAVASVDLGNAIDAEQKVASPTTSFSTKDTIYASVSTTGSAPSAELNAKWTFQDGQTVSENKQTIAPNGPATTSFKIAKPDGWPVGNYKVEISLNGTPVSSKDFSVK